MNSLSSSKTYSRHFNDEIVVGDSVVVDTVVHVPQFSVALVFCDESVVFGVEYVECGVGRRVVEKCVLRRSTTTILKWERLRFFTRVSSCVTAV
jgi:hypothetical protein